LKKILSIIFLLVSQLLAQPDFVVQQDVIQSGKFFNSEIHFFPSNHDYLVYYSYKISNSQLFFEKKDDLFNAGFRVNIEIKDSAGNIVKRSFDDRKISVKNYEITNSPSSFLQGVISFSLPEGKYSLQTLISDQISKRERRIPPIDLEIIKSKVILNPIVFDPGKIVCNELESYILSNNSASVPFNKPTNDLVIPVSNSQINSLNITVRRGETVLIADEKIAESFSANPEIILCDEKVVITRSSDTTNVKLFLAKNFSSKLTEGPIQVEIYPDDSPNEKQIFNLSVIWIGKPLSLSKPEEAVKFIEIIESKAVVSDIFSSSGNDNEKLLNYWSKLDPSPDTKFNELMNEFYTRVDYCEMNFRSLAGNGGAKSDRGKTYIKYGPPDSIERDTDNQDKVVESWTYKKSQRKFVFVDSEGTGKFTIVNGQ
jgi:GWxTD domain-containing protein